MASAAGVEVDRSDTSSPPPTEVEVKMTATTTEATAPAPSRKSLKDRSKIPTSFYITVIGYAGMGYFGNVFRLETLTSWIASVRFACDKLHESLLDTQDLAQTLMTGEYQPLSAYLRVSFVYFSVFSLVYIFFLAPLRAGFWTGSRSGRHIVHRYMGLAYLAQYFLAWFEFTSKYNDASPNTSFMPMFIAINGIIQGWSAYFSFKVLPELTDAGYYSNKAVLSRSFVHENIFYSYMCLLGTVYYVDECRAAIKAAGWPARIFELVFMFGSYTLIRPNFPTTHFSDAGTTKNGRTADSEFFYKYATIAVKIFYLYAKYFLGFYMNFLLFLDVVETGSPARKFMDGLLLLNIGTVSLGIFLHTLRFRKVLPGRFTFSIYLLQIYATFSALPLAFELFGAHLQLCAVCFAGLLCNMTRRKDIQAVWAVGAMVLLSWPGIEW